MRTQKRSLANLRTLVLYLPVLMFVGFLAFVVIPAQDGFPEHFNPPAAATTR